MLWSLCTRSRKYTAQEYVAAIVVTLGCVLFVLTGDISAPHVAADTLRSHPWLLYGGALLALFLIFDGLTSTSQDKLFTSYDMHSCNQLLYVTSWSAVLSFAFLLFSGQFWECLAFVRRHPWSMGWILLQSAISTIVQLFIVFTIKQYGALNFALMMTVRQFLSIVVSCLIFGHALTLLQW